MTGPLLSRHTFYPVGQGTFSSGSLGWVVDWPEHFHWVYDCGSVKATQHRLEAEIQRLALHVPAGGARPRLDLVFVSHFDTDHVSGLVQLLGTFEVGTLVLPHLHLWQRMVLAVSGDKRLNPQTQAFLVDPVAFIDQLDGAVVDRILLVPAPPNDEPPEADASQLPDDNVPPNRERVGARPTSVLTDSEVRSQGMESHTSSRTVQYLTPGASIRVGAYWEFVPYNDARDKLKASPVFRAAVGRVSAALLKAPSSSQRERILSRLAAVYDRTFGARPKKRNQISLFVFSGPLRLGHRVAWTAKVRSAKEPGVLASDLCASGHCPQCGSLDGASSATGVLYTGDGFLANKKQADQLFLHMGRRRMRDLRVLQVMHHGSRYNWHSGLAARLAPHASVFCADKSGGHGHPHKEVEADFLAFGPVKIGVTEGKSWFQVFR